LTRAELRIFLEGQLCGCESPETACAAYLRLLRLHPAYDHRDELKELIPDYGIRLLVMYRLDHDGLTEHGGAVGGAWLTVKGEEVRNALMRELPDDFRALMAPHCVHGFDIDDQTHDCREGGGR
jgi:hypothetical protein